MVLCQGFISVWFCFYGFFFFVLGLSVSKGDCMYKNLIHAALKTFYLRLSCWPFTWGFFCTSISLDLGGKCSQNKEQCLSSSDTLLMVFYLSSFSYLTYIKLSTAIRRNESMAKSLQKALLQQQRSEEDGKRTPRPQDLIRLYDIILQVVLGKQILILHINWRTLVQEAVVGNRAHEIWRAAEYLQLKVFNIYMKHKPPLLAVNRKCS